MRVTRTVPCTVAILGTEAHLNACGHDLGPRSLIQARVYLCLIEEEVTLAIR